jgi:putative acetyltransferase
MRTCVTRLASVWPCATIWQGEGIGTALLRAALELADDWLGLTRIELHVHTDDAAGIAL